MLCQTLGHIEGLLGVCTRFDSLIRTKTVYSYFISTIYSVTQLIALFERLSLPPEALPGWLSLPLETSLMSTSEPQS